MSIRYFSTSWNDIKHSEGWLSKLFLIALLQFVPIFGQMVSLGYMYGWARDIAWDIHSPMPKDLFSNPDGSLFSRGFYLLIISFVFMILPLLLWSIILIVNMDSLILWRTTEELMRAVLDITIPSLLVYVLMLLMMPLYWVGWMRASVYGRIAPGFQLPKIFAMIKHDFGGIMRIFGMYLLLTLIMGIIYSAVNYLVLALTMAPVFGSLATDSLSSRNNALALAGLITSGTSMVFSYALMVGATFIQMVLARSLGYWTRSFGVPLWGGPKDPLPFQMSTLAPPQGQPLVAAVVPIAQASPGVPVAQPANPAYSVSQVPAGVVAPQVGTEGVQAAQGAQVTPNTQGVQTKVTPNQTETKE